MENEKRGISQITGKTEIKLGEKAFYKVSRIHRKEDHSKVKNALWKIYVNEKGSWRELKSDPSVPPKKGDEVSYTITNQALAGKELLVEAYIYEPERMAPPGLKIKVVAGTEKKIQRVELFMRDDTPIKEDTILKYNQTIKVKVYTQNMPNEILKLTLYEDDADEGGHNPKNEKNKVAYKEKQTNDNGFLWHEFKLNAEFSKIANAMMDGSSDKLHEYYVLVESAKHGRKTSKNIEVENPDYTAHQTYENGKVTDHKKDKIYEGGVIEEVIIKGKYKKQMGIDPIPKTGRSVSIVSEPSEKKEEKCPNCEKDITLQEIKQIFPRSANNEKLAQQLIDELNSTKLKYGIDTCLKKAHMVTQMGSETEFRTLREEIDGYSVSTLKTLFGYFKRHPDEAVKHQGNIHELAIRAYGLRGVDKEKDIVSCSISRTKGCNDLGNEIMEEGYTYLGRGLIQLTGKYQYTLINKDFQKAFPNQGNLIKNPELLEIPKYAVMSGLSYWINNNLNNKAEKGSDGEHVDAITKIINKNLDESHYKRRRNFFKIAKTVFKLDECKNKKEEKPIADGNVEVIFDEGTNKSIVSNKSINILKKIAKVSKTPRVIITSTARTPKEQATIMHDQTLEKGVVAQKVLYGPSGEKVIDVYVQQKSFGKTRAEIINKMEEKINELGPSKVSRHCGNQNVLNVFDVSSRRMTNASSFLNEARKYEGTGKEISKIINETDRNCYHFEIPQ